MKSGVARGGALRALVLLLALSVLLYLPTLFHLAFADDEIYLAFSNRFLREAPWRDLYLLLLQPANPWEFLPLRDFTYWLDFRLYGDDNGAFHFSNLLWYCATLGAVLLLFRELVLYCRPEWEANAWQFAMCGSVIFAVHPAHVEVVAWIASRKDLIAATLGFFSLSMLVRVMRTAWSWPRVAISAALLFAACFGKATAMTLVGVAGALILSGVSAQRKTDWWRTALALAVFLGLMVVAFLIHQHFSGETGIRLTNAPGSYPALERASRIFVTLWGILVWPYPLRFYYDVFGIGNFHWWVSVAGAILFLAAAYFSVKRRALWGFGGLLAFMPLLAHLQLVPYTTWSLASERFVFVSVAGLSLVLIDLSDRAGGIRAARMLALVIFLPSALIVWERVSHWENNTTKLLTREYAMNPEFHNSIRDRVVFELLPEKRYQEAERLVARIPRAYAREAYLSLINVDRRFWQWNDVRSHSPGGSDSIELREFCKALSQLTDLVRQGHEEIGREIDVSYNNLLITLERKIKFTYADGRLACGFAKEFGSRQDHSVLKYQPSPIR